MQQRVLGTVAAVEHGEALDDAVPVGRLIDPARRMPVDLVLYAQHRSGRDNLALKAVIEIEYPRLRMVQYILRIDLHLEGVGLRVEA